jgi:hypothetical protein
LAPQGGSGQYLLRIDHLKGEVCWIPLTESATQVTPLVLSIDRCD